MKKILIVVLSVFMFVSSSLLVMADDENINYLDKDKFKEAVKSITAEMAEGSTFNLYFGNVDDYDSADKTLKASFGGSDNNYYSIYCKQETAQIYDIYVLASTNGKVYFPVDSGALLSEKNIVSSNRHLVSINFSNVDTSNVVYMNSMFEDCKSLTSLDLSSFNTSKVSAMYMMFFGCSSLESLDLSNFNTSKVIDMKYMFSGCSSLKSVDLSKFNTSNVTNMEYMFNGCKTLSSLNLSNFDTSNVGDMQSMFENCGSLISLNLNNFNTSKVTNMQRMFYACSSLESLDIENFDTSIVINMSYMFNGCKLLASLNIYNFNTSNVTDMSHMFENCYKLVLLNLSGFDTTKVTNMAYMFNVCESLTLLGLPKFDTTNVTNMTYMFRACKNLNKIYVNDEFVVLGVTSSNEMFNYSSSLVGGNGTRYSSSNANDKTYAHIDVDDNPGYFIDIIDHEHEWYFKTIVKNPTCVDTGIKEYVCLICGDIKQETIDALGHDYSSEWTIDVMPTDTSDGYKSHHCIRCGAKKDITAISKNKIVTCEEEKNSANWIWSEVKKACVYKVSNTSTK